MEARRVMPGMPEATDAAPARRALSEDSAPSAAPSNRLVAARWVVAAMSTVVLLVVSIVFLPGDGQGTAQPEFNGPEGIKAREEQVSRSTNRDPVVPSAPAQTDPPIGATPEASTPQASPSPSASVVPTPEATTASPEPEPTKSASPSATATASAPTKEYETGEVTGERWVTKAVRLRKGPGTEHRIVDTLSANDKVSVTNVVEGRWQQIKVGKSVGFVATEYLTDAEPKTAGAGVPASAQDSCPQAAAIESGLTSKSVKALRAICNRYPEVKNYHGRRSGGGDSYHSSGRAIDVMISGEAGWDIARWLRSNASELGVIEVIYQQKIWTSQRSGEGWRKMSDRGSVTANHYDHVHVSIAR